MSTWNWIAVVVGVLWAVGLVVVVGLARAAALRDREEAQARDDPPGGEPGG